MKRKNKRIKNEALFELLTVCIDIFILFFFCLIYFKEYCYKNKSIIETSFFYSYDDKNGKKKNQIGRKKEMYLFFLLRKYLQAHLFKLNLD